MPASGSLPSTSSKRALSIIFLVVFMDLLGATVLVPVYPYLVRQFRSDALTVGLLSVSFSAAQFLATPALGVLSDRFGRRPVLLLSQLGSAAGYFLFGFGRALWIYFAARILDGLTGANISAAQAYIADVSAPEDRSKNFGLIGAAFGLGFILGPAVGGVLSHISLAAPAFGAGLVGLATFTLGCFLLPESLPKQARKRGPLNLREADPIHVILGSLKKPELRGLLIGVFLLTIAASGLQTNFAVYTLNRFALTPAQNAALFAWLGLLTALIQGGLVRKLSGKVADRILALGGLALSILGYVAVATALRPGWLYLALALMALGTGVANPTLMGLLSKRAGSGQQGRVLGVSQSLGSLARVCGPAWAGAVFDHIAMAAPYWTGAAWLLGGSAAIRHALSRDTKHKMEGPLDPVPQRPGGGGREGDP